MNIEDLYLKYGLLIVFLSSFIEISPLGWAIPGGIILAVGGYFSYGTSLPLIAILMFAWFGAWLTFLLAYFLGHQTGLDFVIKFRQQKNAERAKLLLEKYGGVILTTSLMANLTRFWVAYVAGTQKYSFIKFLFYSATASLAWSSLMVIVGYFAGSERRNLETGLARLGILAWILLVISLGVILLKTRKEFGLLRKTK